MKPAAFDISVEELGHGVFEFPAAVHYDVSVGAVLVGSVVVGDHISEEEEAGVDGKEEGADFYQFEQFLHVAVVAVVVVFVVS